MHTTGPPSSARCSWTAAKPTRTATRTYNEWFEPEGLAFLKSIGAKPREIFDYVEDCVAAEGSEPTPETALLVAAVRRDYFLVMQKGVESTKS